MGIFVGKGCWMLRNPYPVCPLDSGGTHMVVVEPSYRGCRLFDLLDQALAELLPTRRPSSARQLAAAGQVTVNGVSCLHNRRLRVGDVIRFAAGSMQGEVSSAKEAPLPAVLFESASALVVDKPAGLTTVPTRDGEEGGIHELLSRLRPDADLRIVHRLDRNTSGCLLLGKGQAAAQHFDQQFRDGGMHKRYVALTQGCPAQDHFVMDRWLGPDPSRPGLVMTGSPRQRGFRAACTEAVMRQGYQHFALLALHPKTGRSHQLRVHLASAGYPIVGDSAYGGSPLFLSALKTDYKSRPGVPEKPLLARLFLHAECLAFPDLDGTAVTVDSQLPADLTQVLRKLDKYDQARS